jgi:hypothetical protein
MKDKDKKESFVLTLAFVFQESFGIHSWENEDTQRQEIEEHERENKNMHK